MAADFNLSWNGYPFVVPDADLKAWVEARYPLSETADVVPSDQGDPAPNQRRLAAPRPPRYPAGRLNELYYPPGPSEFAVFRGLAHKSDVAKMAAYVQGGHLSSNLRLAGGADPASAPLAAWGAFDVTLYLLPPRPLAGRDDAADLYLVTLVDARYWGRFVSSGYYAPAVGIAEAEDPGQSWANLLANLSPGFGVAVDAGYGRPCPDSDLFGANSPQNVFADAVCANVGRVPAAFLFSAVAPANPNLLPRWQAVNAELLAVRDRWKAYRVAGGLVAADPTADALRVPYMPRLFSVTFPKWVRDVGYLHPDDPPLYNRTWHPAGYPATYTRVVNAATDLGPPYSNWLYRVGPIEAVGLNTTFKATYDLTDPYAGPGALNPNDPDNKADCDALAALLVKDYLDANSIYLDEVYLGLVPFSAYAHCHVVWRYGPDGCTTRVWRPPFTFDRTEFQHSPADATANRSLPSPAVVTVTGGLSGGYYPGTAYGLNVWVADPAGVGLVNGSKYLAAIRPRRVNLAGDARTAWDAADAPIQLTVNTTLVSGGTASAVLYTDGTKLQSGGNVLVSGTNSTLRQQVTGGEWWGLDVGTN